MKGNPFFGPVSGRLGRLSVCVTGGVQVTRLINPEPKNPRTQNQMAQRVQLSNIVSAYQSLSSFLKGAYPDKPQNLSRYNMFIKNNLNKIRVFLDKSESRGKACVVAPYNVSQGSLPPIEVAVQGDRMVSSIRVPQTFRIMDATTLGEVSNALLRANRDLCTGDRLSVIRLLQTFLPEGETMVPRITSEVHEFVLDSSSRLPFHLVADMSLFQISDGFIGTDNNPGNGGIAYVLSREKGNRMYVSTQSIVLTPDNITYQKYNSGEKKQQAADSYGAVAPCWFDSSPAAGKSIETQGIARKADVGAEGDAPVKPVTVGAIPCGCPDARAHESAEHEGSPGSGANRFSGQPQGFAPTVTGVSVTRNVRIYYVYRE